MDRTVVSFASCLALSIPSFAPRTLPNGADGTGGPPFKVLRDRAVAVLKQAWRSDFGDGPSSALIGLDDPY
jgi:hypothetical protein